MLYLLEHTATEYQKKKETPLLQVSSENFEVRLRARR